MFDRLKSLLSTSAARATDECGRYKTKGDRHLERNELDDAAACYRRALSVSPDDIGACVGLGFVLREQRQFREAEHYLRHALSMDSRIADAHYILGIIAKEKNDQEASIRHLTNALELKPDFEHAYRDLLSVLLLGGRFQDAKDVAGRAVSVCPQSAEFQFYLGNLLVRDGDHDNAIVCYRKALAIQPESATLHVSLGDVHTTRGHFDQAMDCYQKAISHEPGLVDAHVKLGNVMQSLGKLDQAISCYQRAIRLKPEYAAARQYLGNAFLERGTTQEAISCYREVIRLEPQNSVKHLLTALAGGDSERAPSEYVEQLFDEYAQTFDSHLVQVLSYSVPQKLAQLLRQYASSTIEKSIVLDLGCGTGLCAAAIAPYARQIVGVDLSAKMLEKAEARKLYDRLEHLDLLTMMRGEPASSYDVVLAADVLVYLGNLDELANQVRRLLRPGGLFAFSVESLAELASGDAAPVHRQDYSLNATGRYAHSHAYLTRIASYNRFEVLTITETTTRRDKGGPVQGYLVLWRRSQV